MLNWLRQRSDGTQGHQDHGPPKPGLVRVMSPDALLAAEHRRTLLRQITHLLALPAQHQKRYVDAVIARYAAWVQLMPASEAHHHAGLGGMLDHGLEVAAKALQIRRGHVLPPGAAPERIVHEADVWTYAVLAAALVHDMAKPVVDQVITLYAEDGRRLGPWEPWHGPIPDRPDAAWYAVRYRRDRRHKLHEPVAPLVAHWVLPACSLTWIARHGDLFAMWTAAIHGDMEQAGPLGQILLQADRESVARNLGGASPDRLPTAAKGLHEKLATALRHLLDQEHLPLNRNGAAGWLTGDDLWLVSKRTADALREQLRQEGHTGVPSSNDRIFDVLQEHGILVPNGERAIWKATVAGDDWSHDLTLIRFPVSRVWATPECRPDEFRGTVSVHSHTGSTADDAKTEATSHATETSAAAEGVTGSQVVNDIGGCEGVTPRSGTEHKTQSINHASHTPQNDREPACPSHSDNAATAKGEQTLSAPTADSDSGHSLPDDNGEAFLAWLRSELAEGHLAINEPYARVHVVDAGLLLLSPGIFRDFYQATGRDWNNAQKRFLKMRLHQKNPRNDTNIHHYIAERDRHTGYLKGILVPDPEPILGAWRPEPNRYLRPSLE